MDRSTHGLRTTAARTVGVVLLTPLVLLAGLLAIVVLAALAVGRRARDAIRARRPAPTPARRREPSAADSAPGMATRRRRTSRLLGTVVRLDARGRRERLWLRPRVVADPPAVAAQPLTRRATVPRR